MASRRKNPAANGDTERAPEVVATPVHETTGATAAPFPDLSALLDDDDADADAEAARRKPGTLITLNPDRIAALQRKGVDVRIAKIRIEKTTEEGRRQRIPGEFPPEAVTIDFLLRRWGPGYYEVKGVNAGGMYIGGSSVHADGVPEIAPFPSASAPVAAAPPANGPSGRSFQEELLLALITQRAAPVAPQEDSLRDAIGAMVKLMTMQMTMSQMQASQSMQAGAKMNGGGIDAKVLELLEKALRPASTTKELGFAQFVPLLQMGMNIGRGMSGAPTPNPNGDMPPWMQMIPELADTVGVPLVVTFAQALLGPEKAKDVVEAIQKHSEARRAEAEAEAAHAASEETEP